METDGLSIKFEQSNAPLRIFPRNTWVKVNEFSSPYRILEISTEYLILDLQNHSEAKMFQAGKKLNLHLLSFSGENSLELNVIIFKIDDSKCYCQLPIYISNEQILLDKIILEIQKNEIEEKKVSSQVQQRHSAVSANSAENACAVSSEENMASILNNLVAMLPEETKDDKENQVVASSLTDIPKSSFEYHAPVSPEKLFKSAYDESEEQDFDEDDEYTSDDEFNLQKEKFLKQKAVCASVHPVTLMRFSIENKFLLDNLPDPFPQETQRLIDENIEQDLCDPEKMAEMEKNFSQRKKSHSSKFSHDDVSNFVPDHLIDGINKINLEEKDRTNEFTYRLLKEAKNIDKDEAFNEYYESMSELPPELVFELMRKAKGRKQEYNGLDPKYLTEEYNFTMRDPDEGGECFDGDESCMSEKLSKMLENKRTIEFNIKDDPNFVPRSKEESDEAFISQLNNNKNDSDLITTSKDGFKFNIDI